MKPPGWKRIAYKTQPLLLCAYEVDSGPILDLTRPETLAGIGFTFDDLACPWELLAFERREPPTWILARQCMMAGIAGIRVPSFAVGATAHDINLVFWTWSSQGPSRIVVIDDEGRLPRDQRSWP